MLRFCVTRKESDLTVNISPVIQSPVIHSATVAKIRAMNRVNRRCMTATARTAKMRRLRPCVYSPRGAAPRTGQGRSEWRVCGQISANAANQRPRWPPEGPVVEGPLDLPSTRCAARARCCWVRLDLPWICSSHCSLRCGAWRMGMVHCAGSGSKIPPGSACCSMLRRKSADTAPPCRTRTALRWRARSASGKGDAWIRLLRRSCEEVG